MRLVLMSLYAEGFVSFVVYVLVEANIINFVMRVCIPIEPHQFFELFLFVPILLWTIPLSCQRPQCTLASASRIILM